MPRAKGQGPKAKDIFPLAGTMMMVATTTTNGKQGQSGSPARPPPTASAPPPSTDGCCGFGVGGACGIGARFTSTHVPPSPGLSGSCQLPFGCILSAFSPRPQRQHRDDRSNLSIPSAPPRLLVNDDENDGTFTTSQPAGTGARGRMVLCLSCLSHLNPYCIYDVGTGRWTCSICGYEDNVADPALFAVGDVGDDDVGGGTAAVVSSVVEYVQRAASASASASVSSSGSAAAAAAASMRSSSVCCYVFVLDGNLPPSEVRGVLRTIRSILLLLPTTTQNDEEEGRAAAAAHTSTINEEARARVGLIIYGRTVSIYQLGLWGCCGLASADVFSCFSPASTGDAGSGAGAGAPDARGLAWDETEEDELLHNRNYLARISYDDDGGGSGSASGGAGAGALDALERCADAYFGFDADDEVTVNENSYSENSDAATTISLSDKAATAAPISSRREMLRRRREERLRKQKGLSQGKQQPSTGSNTTTTTTSSARQRRRRRRKRRSERERKRCTGEAVRLAINLIAQSHDHDDSDESSQFGGVGGQKQQQTGRIVVFTNGCPNHGAGSVVSPVVSSTGDGNAGRSSSAAATAGGASSPSRKGSPRRQRRHAGDIVDPVSLAEASEYYHLLGRDALEAGIGIDVFCSGATALGVPAFQALVSPSDGFTLTHGALSTEEAAANLRYVLTRTHMSRAGPDHDRHGALINNASHVGVTAMNKLNGCILDIRTSCFITPTNVVGPGEVEYDDDRGVLLNELHAFAQCAQRTAGHGLPTNNLPSKDMLSLSLTRLRIGRYDPSATHTIMVQVNDDLQPEDKYGVFQFIARYVTSDGGSLVTRVFTHRLPVARSVHDFLDGIQDEIVPVVLGREAVFRSTFGRGTTGDEGVIVVDRDRDEELTEDARKDVDATVHRISSAFRLSGKRPNAQMNAASERSLTSSSLDFAFPPELADGLRQLYNLRRGPMLGSGPLQSTDDRAVARSLFMRLPMEDCLPMMAPTLWCCRADSNAMQNPTLEPVPAVTLACWDNCVLAADQFDCLYIWSGKEAFGSEYDLLRQECKKHLLAHSKGRFPKPQLYMLKEGDSMSRRLTARLSPAHGDPPEHQMAYFPALSSLPPSDLATLRDKYRFYDANADPSFRRWFWEVASASSRAGKEGESLCE